MQARVAHHVAVGHQTGLVGFLANRFREKVADFAPAGVDQVAHGVERAGVEVDADIVAVVRPECAHADEGDGHGHLVAHGPAGGGRVEGDDAVDGDLERVGRCANMRQFFLDVADGDFKAGVFDELLHPVQGVGAVVGVAQAHPQTDRARFAGGEGSGAVVGLVPKQACRLEHTSASLLGYRRVAVTVQDVGHCPSRYVGPSCYVVTSWSPDLRRTDLRHLHRSISEFERAPIPRNEFRS